MMRFSTALESRALDLKMEALEWMSAAVAGTQATPIWDEIAKCFAVCARPVHRPKVSAEEEEDPFDFIDPAPPIARPLGDEVLDPPASYKDPITRAIETLTISTGDSPLKDSVGSESVVREAAKAAAKKLREKTIHTPDIVKLEDAVAFTPLSAESVSTTGVPKHLYCKRAGKSSQHATASLYFCSHPSCSPPQSFTQKAAAHVHLRRAHLGHALGCLYCPMKKWWSPVAWNAHMDTHHAGQPRFPSRSARVTLEDAQNARLLVFWK